ncbi:MAG: hypothetical protein K0R00_4258 [Herbinix sp.]|jgi:predicted PurR-regulated permease PerM|nr:hypothetical protein [Herbinix sp.]
MKWKDKINWKYFQISLYVIITVLIIISIGLLLWNAPEVMDKLLEVLGWVVKVIKPVIIGFVFAYLMDPLVVFFEKRYEKLKKLKVFRRIVAPRSWAAVTALLIFLLALTGLISLLVFTLTDQIRLAKLSDITKLAQGLMDNVNGLYNSILRELQKMDFQADQFEGYVKEVGVHAITMLKNFVNNTVNSFTNISGYFTTLIFSFIIGFYFILDGRLFLDYLRKISAALFTERANERMKRNMNDLDRVFSGYIRGQLTDALVMMLLISIVLTITGVKFAIVIGVFAGIGNLIPYFGPIVAYISTSLVCLISGDIKTWVISMIALLVIQAIDGNFIGPKLLSQSIQIHPLIVIVSLIFGSALGGFMGMLLAVPVGAYLKLVFARFINHRLEHKNEVRKE